MRGLLETLTSHPIQPFRKNLRSYLNDESSCLLPCDHQRPHSFDPARRDAVTYGFAEPPVDAPSPVQPA